MDGSVRGLGYQTVGSQGSPRGFLQVLSAPVTVGITRRSPCGTLDGRGLGSSRTYLSRTSRVGADCGTERPTNRGGVWDRETLPLVPSYRLTTDGSTVVFGVEGCVVVLMRKMRISPCTPGPSDLWTEPKVIPSRSSPSRQRLYGVGKPRRRKQVYSTPYVSTTEQSATRCAGPRSGPSVLRWLVLRRSKVPALQRSSSGTSREWTCPQTADLSGPVRVLSLVVPPSRVLGVSRQVEVEKTRNEVFHGRENIPISSVGGSLRLKSRRLTVGEGEAPEPLRSSSTL